MPTLRALRRATADKVAPYDLATTGVEGPSGGYVGVALARNRRRLVSSDLVSMDALGSAAEAPPDTLKDDWAYLLTSPPQQRRVPEGGFVGYARADEVVDQFPESADQPVAYFDAERPFLSVVPAETEVEIHAIPPLRGGRSAGLHHHINHALRVMLVEDIVTVPGAAGTAPLDVTVSFPWLTAPQLFVGASPVSPSGSAFAIPGAMLRFDADRVLLVPNTTTSTAQSIDVRVLRPRATWIKAYGSGWGESTVGLVDEDDECLGDADAIALVAAFHVAEEQANQCIVGSAAQAYWLAKASAFAARSPFLRDQRARLGTRNGIPFPDYVSVDGPFLGRWGPGWR